MIDQFSLFALRGLFEHRPQFIIDESSESRHNLVCEDLRGLQIRQIRKDQDEVTDAESAVELQLFDTLSGSTGNAVHVSLKGHFAWSESTSTVDEILARSEGDL